MYKISKMVWASKTALASKTVMKNITAKITTTALLFFLLLFTLTTNLKAQEAGQQKEQQAKKGGWFVGFTPYLLGLSEQKSSSTIVSNPTGSTVDSGSKIFSFTAVAPSGLIFGNGVVSATEHAQDAAIRLCETGSASTDGSNTDFFNFQFALVDGIHNSAIYNTGFSTHCQNHFAGLLANATQAGDSVPNASPKAATAKWSGAGLHFGYEFPEGDRFSLQLHNWKGGDIEVSSQMVVYDYFLSKNFYAGVGSGTIELKALGKTQSQRGSAINLGWQYSFSPSFKLELGYLLLSAEASVTKEIKETRNVVISRTEVGAQTVYVGVDFKSTTTGGDSYTTTCLPPAPPGCSISVYGVKVTSDPLSNETSQVYEVTETQEVTVSNPSAIYIRLTVGF